MIKYDFDIKKVIQIINFLLKRNGKKLNYTKLIKLLYIADKEFIKETNFSITGDIPYSLKNGPILSKIKDLIDENAPTELQVYWGNFFIKNEYNLELVKGNNLTEDNLSDAEIEILKSVDKKYKDYGWKDMISLTHDKNLFPEVEWKKAEEQNTSIKIPVEKIMKSIDRTKEEIEIIEEDVASLENDKKYLSKYC